MRKMRNEPIVIRDNVKNYTLDYFPCLFHVTIGEENVYPDDSEYNTEGDLQLYRYDNNYKFVVDNEDFYAEYLFRIEGDKYVLYYSSVTEHNCQEREMSDEEFTQEVDYYFKDLKDYFQYDETKKEKYDDEECTVYIYHGEDNNRTYYINDKGLLVYSIFMWDDGSYEANKYTYNKNPSADKFVVEAKYAGCSESGYEKPASGLCGASSSSSAASGSTSSSDSGSTVVYPMISIIVACFIAALFI